MAKNKRNWEELSTRKGKRFNSEKGIEQKKQQKKEAKSRHFENEKAKANGTAKGKTAKVEYANSARPKPQKRPLREYFEEQEQNLNLIIGRNPVMEAVKNNREIEKIFVQKNAQGSINAILGKARDKGLVIHYVEKVALDRMANGRPHQGIMAQISPYSYGEMEDVLAIAAERNEDPFVIVLDNLEDPHNLGAIMRTAECCGAHGIIIPKRNSCGITEVVAKASAGAVEYVPCVKVNNIANTLEELKEKGFWIAACDMGDTMYYEQDLTGPMALVVGSEGFGISKLVREKCDWVVSIPMVGKITSLNASNAAAILMYEIRRQRDERRKA